MEYSTPTPQQPLQLSTGNWIAIVALMGAGWMGTQGNDSASNLPIESFYADRVIVTRVTDETIHLPSFGIQITPNNGWAYLRRTGKASESSNYSLTFAHPEHALLTTITAVKFKKWPPEFTGYDDETESIPVDSPQRRPPGVDAELTSTQYQHLKIDWYITLRYPYLTHQYGRIDTGVQELLVEVLSLPGAASGAGTTQLDAITHLCDQIAPY